MNVALAAYPPRPVYRLCSINKISSLKSTGQAGDFHNLKVEEEEGYDLTSIYRKEIK